MISSSYSISPLLTVSASSPLPILPSSLTLSTPYISAPVIPLGTLIIPGTPTIPQFLDLNKNRDVQKQVTKYFRYKTLDKWLYGDMLDILGYFTISGGSVDLIKKLSDYRDSTDINRSESDNEKIIEWIEKYILTYDAMSRILTNFVKETNANWYDLHKNEYFIKDIIQNKLKSIIKHTIGDK